MSDIEIILKVKIRNNAAEAEDQHIPVSSGVQIMSQTEGTIEISWSGQSIY